MFQDFFNTVIEILKSIVSANNPETVTKAERFNTDQVFNFSERGARRKGVRSVSIRNIGNYTLIVKDVYEPIKPGETFILSDYLCVNTQFEVVFEDVPSQNGNQPIPDEPVKDAVLRYNVDIN